VGFSPSSSIGGGGGGGGVVQQGARDATAQAWYVDNFPADTLDVNIASSAATLSADVTDRVGRLLGVVSGGANVFHVDDNGGSLTVDGTVAATQGTTPWVVGDGGGSLTVDGTVSVTQPVEVAGVDASSGALTPLVTEPYDGRATLLVRDSRVANLLAELLVEIQANRDLTGG
jgi:hypothetical protein